MLFKLIQITEYLSLYLIIIKLQENKFPYILYLQHLNLFCKQKIIFEKVLGHGETDMLLLNAIKPGNNPLKEKGKLFSIPPSLFCNFITNSVTFSLQLTF